MKMYQMDFATGKMVDISVPANSAKNNLPIGTVLFFNGYGNHNKVITKNLGIIKNFESHGALYEYVDLENYTTGRADTVGLNHISERKDNRIALYYTNEILPLDAVLSAVENAKTKAQFQVEEKARNAERSKNLIEKIKRENPHLVQGQYQVVAAKNIRIELKKAFPSVKFSVTSKSYSGGDHVDVHWIDGPTTDEVEKIARKYQKGSFDGMTDSYDYSKAREWTDTFGGSKYVMESRSISPANFQKVADELNYGPAVWNSNQGEFSGISWEDSQRIKREVYKRSF